MELGGVILPKGNGRRKIKHGCPTVRPAGACVCVFFSAQFKHSYPLCVETSLSARQFSLHETSVQNAFGERNRERAEVADCCQTNAVTWFAPTEVHGRDAYNAFQVPICSAQIASSREGTVMCEAQSETFS